MGAVVAHADLLVLVGVGVFDAVEFDVVEAEDVVVLEQNVVDQVPVEVLWAWGKRLDRA